MKSVDFAKLRDRALQLRPRICLPGPSFNKNTWYRIFTAKLRLLYQRWYIQENDTSNWYILILMNRFISKRNEKWYISVISRRSMSTGNRVKSLIIKREDCIKTSIACNDDKLISVTTFRLQHWKQKLVNLTTVIVNNDTLSSVPSCCQCVCPKQPTLEKDREL